MKKDIVCQQEVFGVIFENIVSSPLEVKTKALAIFLFQGKPLDVSFKPIDQALDGLINNLLENKEFRGEEEETYIIPTLGKLKAERLIMVGMGKEEDFNHDTIRKAAAYLVKAIKKIAIQEYVAMMPEFVNLDEKTLARSFVEGTIMGFYDFKIYKTEEKEKNRKIETVKLMWSDNSKIKKADEGKKVGEVIANVVNYVRDLGNQPANVMTPSRLASEAQKLSEEYDDINVKIFSLDDSVKMGMNLFYAVAKGSNEPAKFIILEYNMNREDLPLYAIIGKGITFDSGGLSLKPSEGMESMKYDMCGAAAVLGIMKAAAELKLPIRLVGVIPATENMPSGSATKPGDIMRSYTGITVEIVNTDAEGRLILADALGYVSKNYKPRAIVDLATLTGACVVALGHYASGLFTKDDSLAEKIIKAGEKSGDRVWRLPLWPEYYEQIKSDFADIKNVGGKPAGAITAAAFLSKFITNDISWAHLDIAGTAFVDKERAYIPKGATGAGVRVVIQFLLDEIKNKEQR